ncbi:MAG TPA: chitinase [Polyangium sp.]|nr:chitinase [Polyangium sp.]
MRTSVSFLVAPVMIFVGCSSDPQSNNGGAGGSSDGGAGAISSSSSSGAGGASSSSSSGQGGSSSSSSGGQMGNGFSAFVSATLYDEMFPNRNALYSYDALVAAADAYPVFGNEGTTDDRKREIAAFLANISHETTGGWPTAPGGAQAWGLYFTQEVGCETGACTQYCDGSNVQYPCAPGKTYHGRGPIQLSWNYNYGFAGEAMGLPLLTNPDLVTSDGAVAFKTGIWFWITPQMPKPSCHDVMAGKWTPTGADTAAGRLPGFGMTVNIINGGLECSKPTPTQVEDRVKFYQRYAQLLGVDPGPNLYCDQMQHY